MDPSSAPTELSPRERAEVAHALGGGARSVGPYVVVRELGRGGMGVVLLTWDPRLQRLVAIKQLLGLEEGPARQRFQREAQLAAGLRHPGIAQVYEVALEGPGAPWIALEYVRGESLAALARTGQLSPRRAAELLLSACEGVAAAHAAGVVHRDLKPQNIVVTPGGQAVVLDFGLARRQGAEGGSLTRTGTIMGTPAYAPPELLEDARAAGPPADVYGLGATLYECLTGRPPFQGSPTAVITAVLTKPVSAPRDLRPDLPVALEAICLRCLTKEPAERYPDAQALAADLRLYLAGQAVQARPRARGRRLIGPLLAAGLTLGAGAAWFVSARSPRPAAEAALQRVEQALRCEGRPRQADPAQEVAQVTASLTAARAALADLEATLVRAPHDGALHLLRARALCALSRQDEALAACARARELTPSLGEAWLVEARARIESGLWEVMPTRRDESRADRLEAVSRCLERAQALGAAPTPLTRAWQAILAGDAASAGTHLDQVRDEDPAQVALARAFLAWRARLGPAAIGAALDAALALAPRWPLLLRQRALWLLDQGRPAEALRELELALLLVADAPGTTAGLRLLRGRALEATGDLAGAAAEYRAAITLRPSWPQPWPWLQAGLVLERLGEHAESIRHLDQALAQAPHWAWGLAARGAYHVRRGHLKQGLADLDHALEHEPDLAAAWRDRAVVRARLGEPDSDADLEKALALDPDDPVALRNRALRRGPRGDLAGALTDAERAAALAPRDPAMWVTVGEVRRKKSDLPGALQALDEAVRVGPAHAEAFADRALTRRKLGDLQGALADYDRALELDPAPAAVWKNRAVARHAAGDLEGAVRDLDACLERDPHFAEAGPMRQELQRTLARRAQR